MPIPGFRDSGIKLQNNDYINVNELALIQLKEEYDEIKQDLLFAIEKQRAFEEHIYLLKEKRLAMSLKIARCEQRRIGSDPESTMEEKEPTGWAEEPDSTDHQSIRQRLGRLESLVSLLKSQLSVESD